MPTCFPDVTVSRLGSELVIVFLFSTVEFVSVVRPLEGRQSFLLIMLRSQFILLAGVTHMLSQDIDFKLPFGDKLAGIGSKTVAFHTVEGGL